MQSSVITYLQCAQVHSASYRRRDGSSLPFTGVGYGVNADLGDDVSASCTASTAVR